MGAKGRRRRVPPPPAPATVRTAHRHRSSQPPPFQPSRLRSPMKPLPLQYRFRSRAPSNQPRSVRQDGVERCSTVRAAIPGASSHLRPGRALTNAAAGRKLGAALRFHGRRGLACRRLTTGSRYRPRARARPSCEGAGPLLLPHRQHHRPTTGGQPQPTAGPHRCWSGTGPAASPGRHSPRHHHPNLKPQRRRLKTPCPLPKPERPSLKV